MTGSNAFPDPPEWLAKLDPEHFPELSARDWLHGLGIAFDIESQLDAIQYLLRRNAETEAAHSEQIRLAEEKAKRLSGIWNDYATDEYVSLMHESVYQDAAHSMAAIGMLAPFFETVFFQCFLAIGTKLESSEKEMSNHSRWQDADKTKWDCHLVFKNGQSRTDLVQGILQLADAVGVCDRFPGDLKPTLEALFGYRNKMFHCGFEWPVDERSKFANRIAKEKWPAEWFSSATFGGEPWVFYMTSEFIEHCLSTIDLVLIAFGEFVRDELTDSRRRDLQ
ncbi:hypothetical protein [Novipirellula rosea]|uniref:RiboL-PSP-HEPN domain-containing protein n=1 Tax=Novipirellula rosea TaxID=1031540 RepID=A0ABP8MAV1_9BACT